MLTYVSMLRGINVSGQKKIIMADLRMIYEGLGFDNVMTYIQSGNVIFCSKIKSAVVLSKKISEAIEAQYGFTVPVAIRTREEFDKLIEENPYSIKKKFDMSKLYVTLLETKPMPSQIKSLAPVKSNDDVFRILKNNIYVYCPGGYGKTRLSNKYFENELKQSATTRNWKTITHLYSMACR